MSDIFSVCHTLEGYTVDTFIGQLDCSFEVLGYGCDCQHSSSRGDEFAVFQCSTGVEHHDIFRAGKPWVFQKTRSGTPLGKGLIVISLPFSYLPG